MSLSGRTFPRERWQDFQKTYLLQELLRNIPELQAQENWPSTEDWQDYADRLGIWERLPQRLRFQAQKALGQRARRRQKKRESYESSILEKGEIPTRLSNLHDFFNALIWLRYPKAKWSLHHRAFLSQKDQGDSERRSELCDRLTCFDEGGLIFRRPPHLDCAEVDALFRSRDEESKRRFCQEHRERFFIFGHGILEVLFEGRESVFASCCILSESGEGLDAELARYLESSGEHGGIDVNWLLEAADR